MAEALPQDAYADPRTPRQRYLARLRQLEKEASGWITLWQELADHFMPGSVRVHSSDRLKAPVPNADIMNGIGTLAQRTATSGIVSSLTSPSRPWFKTGTADPELMHYGPVRQYLHHVDEAMFKHFAQSNLYQALPMLWANVGVHGTACGILEEDPLQMIRIYVWAVGSFFLANSPRLTIDTAYRRFALTVDQLVRSFGLDRVSRRVKNLWEHKQLSEWIDVVRVVEPNDARDPRKMDAPGMEFRSCWFEYAGGEREGLLHEGGFRENPILAPRWEVVGEDTYGRGCGYHALPDSRMLQHYARRDGQAVDALVSPALAKSSAQVSPAYPLPGEIVSVPFSGQQNAMQPIYEMQPSVIEILDKKQARLEDRISQFWYSDLWLMLAEDDRNQRPTAREVVERHEEKIVQLGPVLDRIFECLNILISRSYQIFLRRGAIQPPPRELQGQLLRIEYISPLAQAQKLVGIASDERLAGFVGNIAGVKPDIIDKLNFDRLVESYAERTSADPDVVVPQEKVDAMRAARAQAAQQHAAVTEQMPAAAQTAKVLSETDIHGESALNRLLTATGARPAAGGGI